MVVITVTTILYLLFKMMQICLYLHVAHLKGFIDVMKANLNIIEWQWVFVFNCFDSVILKQLLACFGHLIYIKTPGYFPHLNS